MFQSADNLFVYLCDLEKIITWITENKTLDIVVLVSNIVYY
jgi:hypothetical protein